MADNATPAKQAPAKKAAAKKAAPRHRPAARADDHRDEAAPSSGRHFRPGQTVEHVASGQQYVVFAQADDHDTGDGPEAMYVLLPSGNVTHPQPESGLRAIQ
jgi:hypothetical protein